MDIAFQPEMVRLAELKPHPRNYRQHPEDQLAHLMASIKEHGLYRNVVVAAENTILAGHGVVQALAKLGYETVSVIRMDVAPDSTAALKVLTGDNEIDHLAVLDDRMLTEILKDLQQAEALVGTGYDDATLATLLNLGVPASEAEFPDLQTGEKAPFQQMTFTLHDGQAAQVKAALETSRGMGAFVDSPNENGNGNALARICETFLAAHGNG